MARGVSIEQYLEEIDTILKDDFEKSDVSSREVDVIYQKDIEGRLSSYTLYLCLIGQSRISKEELQNARKDVKSKIHDKRSSSRVPGVDLVSNAGHQPHIIYVGVTDEVIPDTKDFILDQRGVAEWRKYLQEFVLVDVSDRDILQKSGRNQRQSRASDIIGKYLENPL